jgi:hypothetical protein
MQQQQYDVHDVDAERGSGESVRLGSPKSTTVTFVSVK